MGGLSVSERARDNCNIGGKRGKEKGEEGAKVRGEKR